MSWCCALRRIRFFAFSLRSCVFAFLFLAGEARAGSLPAAPTVLLEAESFDRLGTWVVDQQFMDQMGSPFLLAHGLGKPVQDAVTKVKFPKAGLYRLWVRTRDWVAPWGVEGAPGRFQVYVGGKAVPVIFGTEGARWHWQDGGTVEISFRSGEPIQVALHDLTGFEGRCDALLFTLDHKWRPPDGGPALEKLRYKLSGISDRVEDCGIYDLVVVGGGIAGTCAAVSGARLGLEVCLIQDRPVLGGNNSSEVRVWLGGGTNFKPYPRVGDLVRELDPRTRECPGKASEYGDDLKLAVVKAEPKLRLFLNVRVNEVQTEGNRIVAVIGRHVRTGKRFRFRGRFFADTTGDGVVGYLAGADWDMTRKGHMGNTNLWRIEDTGAPAPFPRCPWALNLAGKPFPKKLKQLGRWFWESGFDRDPFKEGEYIRDLNFRAMYGAWDYLKNVKKLYPNHAIVWAAYVAGKRESRRLLGDIVLTKEDLTSGRRFPDGCVPATWKIDLHLPDPRYVDRFGADAFISRAYYTDYPRPYWIPYRCLYSRNIENLFMAGRDISVTHEALGAVRVQRTTGMMGEIVGMAAWICCKRGVNPRGVYRQHLEELKELMRRGVGKASLRRPAGAGRRAETRMK